MKTKTRSGEGRGYDLSSFFLRYAAFFFMLLDHIGAVFFPDLPFLRDAGRISFPLFAFLVTEGAEHTRSGRAYLTRMLLLALISEIPYDLCFYGRPFFFKDQNVLFTLIFGLVFCLSKEREERRGENTPLPYVLLLAGGFAAELIRANYGAAGVLLIAAYFEGRDARWSYLPITLVFSALFGGNEYYALLSLIFIFLYRGRKGIGGKAERIVSYSFYPLHLILLSLFHFFLK